MEWIEHVLDVVDGVVEVAVGLAAGALEDLGDGPLAALVRHHVEVHRRRAVHHDPRHRVLRAGRADNETLDNSIGFSFFFSLHLLELRRPLRSCFFFDSCLLDSTYFAALPLVET